MGRGPAPGERRDRLIALYAEMAVLTEPECLAFCPRPMTCCEERYCTIAMEFAAEHWDVELVPTWHRVLPMMGPDGCTVAPHLRPICTAHTCDICEHGAKRGDPAWTERYYALKDAIASLEAEILGDVFISG